MTNDIMKQRKELKMATEIGKFHFTQTNLTYMELTTGKITSVRSYKGTADGFGTPYGSLSQTQSLADAGSNSGDCTWIAKTMLDDGTIIGDIAHGTWERIGQEARAAIKLNNNLSDGRKLRCEAILDHEIDTFSGTIYSVD